MIRDLRKYARQTTVRVAAGAVLLLFIVGDGLIYLIYGKAAAVMGLLCLVGGMIPIALIFAILFLMEWISKRANPD
jgi:hypothetical protein